jgi:hypothetical protein
MGLLWTFWFFHRMKILKDFILEHVLKNMYNYPNKIDYLSSLILNKYELFKSVQILSNFTFFLW